MLSSVAVRSGVFGSLLKSQASIRVLAVVPAGSRSKTKSAEATMVETWDKAHSIFYGPERDTKNFPHPVMPLECPKVRLGFIPETWFQFFYPKTGVTGPYLFGVGLVATLLSKEIWVIDHGFSEVIGFYGGIIVLTKTIGPKMSKWLQTKNDLVHNERFVKPIVNAKAICQKKIDFSEKAIWQESGQKYLWEAKRENVALQLEAAYRQRLQEVYKEVKNRLDYQLEVVNVKRRFEQAHMVNWIVENVKKSITPKQEQENIKNCIAALKSLATTA